MKKYNEFLNETLADELKFEPSSAAAAQAKKMGLTYAGFGRYADTQGNIAYIVQNERLIPFKKMADVQTMYSKAMQIDNPEKAQALTAQADIHSFILQNRDIEDQDIITNNAEEVEQTNQQLNDAYDGAMNEDQVAAIQDYVSNSFQTVNRYLYKGHDDAVDAQTDQQITGLISAIDSAFDNVAAPFDYSTYMGLSSRYQADKIIEDQQYMFRGYVSTSLDPMIASSSFTDQESVLFQIEVQKNQKALHIDSITGEKETLLPRGTVIKILTGPHPFDTTILGKDIQGTISLFHCVIIDE